MAQACPPPPAPHHPASRPCPPPRPSPGRGPCPSPQPGASDCIRSVAGTSSTTRCTRRRRKQRARALLAGHDTTWDGGLRHALPLRRAGGAARHACARPRYQQPLELAVLPRLLLRAAALLVLSGIHTNTYMYAPVPPTHCFTRRVLLAIPNPRTYPPHKQEHLPFPPPHPRRPGGL